MSPVKQQVILDDKVSARLKVISVNFRKLSTAATTSMQRASVASAKLGQQMSGISRIMKRVSLVGAGVFLGALKSASDFEKGIAEVSTLIRGITKKEIKQMSKELRNLAKASGESLSALSKAKYDIVSAGFQNAADSAMLLAASVKLGTAGASDAATAADVLTTALNSYNLGAKDATKVSDKLFKIVELGKTTLNEIAGSLGRATAIAATAGVSLTELGAAIGALTAAGQGTEEAITAIRAATIELTKPSKELAAALRSVGVESGEALVAEEGLQAAFLKVVEAAKKNNVSVKSLVTNIRAMQAIVPLTSTASEKFAFALTQMADAGGSVNEAYLKMVATFDRQFKIVKSKVKDIFVELGTQIMPDFRRALDRISDWVDINQRKVVDAFKNIFDTIVLGIQTVAKNANWLKEAFKIGIIVAITVKIALLAEAIGGLALALIGITLTPAGVLLVGIGLLAVGIGAVALAARGASPDVDDLTDSLQGLTRGVIISQMNALNKELEVLEKKAKGLGALFTPSDVKDRIKEITVELKNLNQQLTTAPGGLSTPEGARTTGRGVTVIAQRPSFVPERPGIQIDVSEAVGGLEALSDAVVGVSGELDNFTMKSTSDFAILGGAIETFALNLQETWGSAIQGMFNVFTDFVAGFQSGLSEGIFEFFTRENRKAIDAALADEIAGFAESTANLETQKAQQLAIISEALEREEITLEQAAERKADVNAKFIQRRTKLEDAHAKKSELIERQRVSILKKLLLDLHRLVLKSIATELSKFITAQLTKLLIHQKTELAKTKSTVAGAAARGFALAAETGKSLINAAASMVSAVATMIEKLVKLLGPAAVFAIPAAIAILIGAFKIAKSGLGFAHGGSVPGTGTGDTVPASLTPGEFVIPAGRVRTLGIQNVENFSGVSRSGGSSVRGVQHFQEGGQVQQIPAGQTIQVNLTVHINALDSADVEEFFENRAAPIIESMIEDGLIGSGKFRNVGIFE